MTNIKSRDNTNQSLLHSMLLLLMEAKLAGWPCVALAKKLRYCLSFTTGEYLES
jgi:hypothetical protein